MSDNQDSWTSQAKPVNQATATGQPEQWMQAWAKEVLLEQRRARRSRLLGGVFRGLLTLTVLFLVFGSGKLFFSSEETAVKTRPHLALVDIKGTIEADGRASASQVLQGVERAFKAPGAKAVVLRINSPGGSPVQAGQIYDGIIKLKEDNPHLPVYAVIEDLGASGGYYIAVAADTILADRASLVGSIGVVSGGFSFKEAMERLGIKRRVFTSGDNKAFLDPFTEMNEEQRAFWQSILDSTHQQFIQRVKAGRGDRLANNPQVFSGLVWNGELALKQGLIDELGSIYTLQDSLNVQNSVNYTPEPNPWQLLEKRLGVAFKTALVELVAPSY